MYDLIREEIEAQLTDFANRYTTDYGELKKAWARAREWSQNRSKTRPTETILVPYIGSGLNYLAESGLGSWGALVAVAKTFADRAIREEFEDVHRVRRSQLSLPQELEIYLVSVLGDSELKEKLVEGLGNVLGEATPTRFHARLAEMFPVLMTTNYNDLLAASDTRNRQVVDLTDEAQNINSSEPSIIHLHGRWVRGMNQTSAQARLFAGVGVGERDPRPCFVVTENQYFRLYSDEAFLTRLRNVFASNQLLMFIGASLSNDESGIHNLLKERWLGGNALAGLYVGFDIDEPKRRLLEGRGIRCFSISRNYGYSRAATESLFHALFDILEARFNQPAPNLISPVPHLEGPDILCVGLSAWNRIFCLPAEAKLRSETSHVMQTDNLVEEPGGQHLAPALHLVYRGHRVALASSSGDDELGDRLKNQSIKLVQQARACNGDGDLFTRGWKFEKDKSTRLTTAITYGGKRGGTRVIFDHDGRGRGEPAGGIDWFRWTSLKALYLGSYFMDYELKLLGGPLAQCGWKFFESGTRGPKDNVEFEKAVKIAGQCDFVLSSSAFLLRLAGQGQFSRDPKQSQGKIHAAFLRKEHFDLIEAAAAKLWPNQRKRGVLVVLMGGSGTLVATENGEPKFVPITDVRRGVNWLGCGDLFRAEFIHQVMSGVDSVPATRIASQVVAQKIQRHSFYEWARDADL